MRWLPRLLARVFRTPPQPFVHLERPEAQAAFSCLHVNGFGPRHWHAKGTVPGYKSAGHFAQCISWCRACIPA